MYIQAEKILQTRKDRADQEAYAFLQEQIKDETFRTLFEQQQTLIIQLGKQQYLGNNTQQLEKELEINRQQQEQWLAKKGLDINQLSPQYHCTICQDTGKVENGRCKCFYKIISQILLEESNIKDRILPSFRTTKLDIFDKEYRDNIHSLYATAKKYIDKLYETNKQFFILCGMSGTGKTYLAECMVSYAIEKYIPTYYVTSFQFNNDMLNCHIAKLEDKTNILQKYLDCDLLVIDDLGTEPIMKNVTLEYLYLILNDRYINHKKTVITTNLFPDDLMERYEERIFSRLTNQKDSVFVEMQSNNIRHKK